MPKSLSELRAWLRESIPVMVLRNIVYARAVKVCSGVSPDFAWASAQRGFDSYTVKVPGHAFNVVNTDDGPVEVDLSYIQFQVPELAKQQVYSEDDPFGEERAVRALVLRASRNPFSAVRVTPVRDISGYDLIPPYDTGFDYDWFKRHSDTLIGNKSRADTPEKQVYMDEQDPSLVDPRLTVRPRQNPVGKGNPLLWDYYVPKPVVEAFENLGYGQRDRPEREMLRAQRILGGGVLSVLLEHVGDLTHRMTSAYPAGGYPYVLTKVKQGLHYLKRPYGFEREYLENMDANKVSAKKAKTALAKYAQEHAKLPVYNEAQWLAREAAISLGLQDWDRATECLERLNDHLGSDEEWLAYAGEYKLNADGTRAATWSGPSRMRSR